MKSQCQQEKIVKVEVKINDKVKVKRGQAYFNQNFDNCLIQNWSINACLQSTDWRIDNHSQDNGYKQKKWNLIFKQMLQSRAEQIWLDQNKQSSILKDISYVKFTRLKILSLFGNQIDNVEPLGWMDLKNLQTISLCQNYIYGIKCFKKLYLQSLSKIYLRGNPLLEIQSLTKAKLNPINIQKLTLELIRHRRQDPISQDISFIAKLATVSISKVNIRSNQRMLQIKVQQMLNQFYLPEIDFSGDYF